MSVIRLPVRGERNSAPLVCLVDLQVEYVAEGRPLALAGRDPWLDNCARLLAFAREHRMPVAHFRQLRRDGLFNRASPLSDWIDAFRPRPFEMIFEREKPSCYASEAFCDYLANVDQPMIVLAGLTAEGACLATAIEASHRNHGCIFVADASATHALAGVDETKAHAFLCDVIELYAEMATTESLMMKYIHHAPSERPVYLREERS
jgi:nicotinamidase-related amidase